MATSQLVRSSRRKAAPGRWELPGTDAEAAALAQKLAAALELSPACARILVRRGYSSVDDASVFPQRRMDALVDPARLPDIKAAIAHIEAAVAKQQHIVLFGDYDVDGITSTALLTRFFESNGSIRKAVSIIKKRSGRHEKTIRELLIEEDGVQVGPALTQFQGVLTGVPALTAPLDKPKKEFKG